MIYIKPCFFDDFKCKAEKCTDNCCIGWEIDIDDETLEKYNSVSGDFGEILRENIIKSPDGSNCFKLKEKERCAFLNENNLCDIIINCGEESLCDICREHPRFYEWFPGVTECGLGLSCEEVCRIILENDSPIEFSEYDDGEKIELSSKDDIAESDTYIFLSSLREVFFDILKNESLSFEEKLVKILEKTEQFTGEKCRLHNEQGLVDLYMETDPVDDEWTEYISDLANKLSQITELEESVQKELDQSYSKILTYILYRHFIKAVFDRSICERVCFSIDSLRFIMLCDKKTVFEKGELTIADRINNLKRWSKQIEYSEENTDYLIFGE